MDAQEKLMGAVFLNWLSFVRAGKGKGRTVAEMIEEYGFTGDFAGLNKFYKDPQEMAEAIERFLAEDLSKLTEEFSQKS